MKTQTQDKIGAAFIALVVIILLVLCARNVKAQDSLKVATNDRFGLNTALDTGKELIVEGDTFKVWSTKKSGSEFLKCTSPRTGNDYPVWIGTTTEQKLEGYVVRQTKSGKKFFLKLNVESNNPICIYLTQENK